MLKPEDYKNLVNIPEDYVENVYEEYLSNTSERMEMRFSHIMVDKSSYDSNEDAYQKIVEAKNELNQGKSFEEVVSVYSDDIVSKDTGGDLEYFDADIFPQEFGSALDSMNVNDISNIIELEDTFHILKMTEFNEAEVVSLEEMQKGIIDDLINSESLALRNDDYDLIDEMSFSKASTSNSVSCWRPVAAHGR